MIARPPVRDSLPGLGLVLSLIAIGIIWTAVSAAQRLHVADAPGDSRYALPDMRINVNAASEAELTLLPGIGPRLAERIVQDRETQGDFASLADLTRVKWIGPAIIERIGPFAFAGDEETR